MRLRTLQGPLHVLEQAMHVQEPNTVIAAVDDLEADALMDLPLHAPLLFLVPDDSVVDFWLPGLP